MSTKYFTATCKQLAENEFLVESSEGGKLQFRIEMKDGEKKLAFLEISAILKSIFSDSVNVFLHQTNFLNVPFLKVLYSKTMLRTKN
jgi:hypothetical protein